MVNRSYFLCQLVLIDNTCLGFSVWTVANTGGQDHLEQTVPGSGSKEAVGVWYAGHLSPSRIFQPLVDTWIKKREGSKLGSQGLRLLPEVGSPKSRCNHQSLLGDDEQFISQ